MRTERIEYGCALFQYVSKSFIHICAKSAALSVAVGLVTYVCRTALNRPPVGAEERPGGLWKVFLLALVVFALLFLPRVILPQPLVTLWMPAAVVVTLLPLLVSALLDRRTDL